MRTPEDNIKIILADWLDALRRHDLDALELRMAPDVFWQGIREDFICKDREEAMKMLREQQREEHGVEALELVATEEKVVLGVRSSQLQEIGGVPLGGQVFQVFTLRHHDGRIVRVDEYRRRSEALEAAGTEDRGDLL
jgi:ketosteroid isomerase-like protein